LDGKGSTVTITVVVYAIPVGGAFYPFALVLIIAAIETSTLVVGVLLRKSLVELAWAIERIDLSKASCGQ
jgi:hypothetical protein